MKTENVKVMAGLSAFGLSMVGFAHTTASVFGFNKEFVAGSVALMAAFMIKKAVAALTLNSAETVLKNKRVADSLGMNKKTNVTAASGVRLKNVGAVVGATAAAVTVANVASASVLDLDDESFENELGTDDVNLGGGMVDITDEDQLANVGSAIRDMYGLDD